jgi:arabinofuranosyltransferase
MKWSEWCAPATLMVAPVTLAWLGWQHRWTTDDGFISLRVVQNLLAGYGPVWNVDERVEIYTSPLWVLLLTVSGAIFRTVRLEWIAVLLGLLCSVVGLLAAERGALLLARTRRGTGPVLPLGALVVAVVPPYWDYATSGLETGLALVWLGICFWGLVRLSCPLDRGDVDGGAGDHRSPDRSRTPPLIHHEDARRATWLAITIGLGPLVRPDLAVMSAGFLLLLFGLCWPARLPQYLRIMVASSAIPMLYHVFRMGYFAALVPNPALAKEAFGVYWSQGWRYLKDFISAYWLWTPCLALFAAWLFILGDTRGARRRGAVALLVVPVVSGMLHGAYVVRVGGDFMHGRLLLPSLFTVLLPVSVVTGGRWWRTTPLLVVVPWAIVCAGWLRVPYVDRIDSTGIADEHGLHVAFAGRPHPVTLEDYERVPFTYDGRALHRLALTRRALLLGDIAADKPPPSEVALAPWVATQIVASRPNVGLLGYAAGARVHVVDRFGLGDPLAGRLRIERRSRPGHEKWLTDAWIIARFADSAAQLPRNAAPPWVIDAARSALACPPLAELLEAIGSPLTPARFFRNVGVAWRLRSLSIPSDPWRRAAAEICFPADGSN